MGLTIHYEFKLSKINPALARKQVDELRQRALALPFEHVGQVQFLTGRQCMFEEGCDKLHFMAAMNQNGVNEPFIQPKEIIAFNFFPGNSCEEAWFGLRRFEGYSWEAFCKTCHAETALDFLRNHLGVIKMLDHAAEMGLLRRVNDEGGYWEDRNWRELLRKNGRWESLSSREEARIAKQLGVWFDRNRKPANRKQYVYEEE